MNSKSLLCWGEDFRFYARCCCWVIRFTPEELKNLNFCSIGPPFFFSLVTYAPGITHNRRPEMK
jgi:hypothetical protein